MLWWKRRYSPERNTAIKKNVNIRVNGTCTPVDGSVLPGALDDPEALPLAPWTIDVPVPGVEELEGEVGCSWVDGGVVPLQPQSTITILLLIFSLSIITSLTIFPVTITESPRFASVVFPPVLRLCSTLLRISATLTLLTTTSFVLLSVVIFNDPAPLPEVSTVLLTTALLPE